MQPDVIGGRYRVGQAIGRGAMGTVWLCRDEMLQRDVAVKQVGLLPGESVTDSARALREARTSAALSHRNVVTVFDVVEDHDAIWLVMEHVPSRSLKEMVDQDGPLDPARAADIGAQVAEGLGAAHAIGTMHRDVKPGNVLVREDGLAKISDFGIARQVGEPTLTRSGLITGTPCYFSPELANGSAPGPAADVWALGATIYAAVEGRPPYSPQQNPVAVLQEIVTRQPPAPTRADYLEPVLLRMLDRDPDSRWSMADAAHSLRRLADEHQAAGTRQSTRADTLVTDALRRPEPEPAPAPSTPASPPPASPTPASSTPASPPPASSPPRDRRPRAQEPRRSRRGLAALAVVALVLLIVGGVAYLVSRDGSGSGRSAGDGASGTSSASPSASKGSSDADSGSGGSGSGGSGALADQRSFLRSYFEAAPGGTDAAWAQLGPREKSVGRASYNRFWGSIDAATVSDVRRGSDPNTVEVTVRYEYQSGKVVEERQRLDLVKDGDGYLIDNDDVLSSRTVRQ